MTLQIPRELRTNIYGFEELNLLLEKTEVFRNSTIDLDFSKNIWFDANLCAILAAVKSHSEKYGNKINVKNCSQYLHRILQKNHFLNEFGYEPIHDQYGTTIKFMSYLPNEENLFKQYLDNELLAKDSMPGFSIQLQKKMNESIFEIFENAIFHGKTNEVYTCGQYFPRHLPPHIEFTIVDLGRTIQANVGEYLNKAIIAKDAIEWAVEKGHTTKTGDTPGGLGLKLIREFLKLNKGQIQIVSGDGYWCENNNTIFAQSMKTSFPGTIISLNIRIDGESYCLKSEQKNLTEEDIF
ncbi:hypothetical protein GQR60_00850 [Labilibaculum sp. A4]|uniref:ATP-binding protein n=1 Tax=Labilibaculum euxinus TaxID=2686357 RepID=UPI000F62544F|nr:ATP-binding protein [Labilibaculum euxinus]MDQ1769363.1 hypothetical protein [Labilibaculum euxinus]MWN74889.1 hypothetical protein [Labilibaculum euxinus]